VKFQEILRRLAIFDDELAREVSGLGVPRTTALDGKTEALLQVAVSVAIGSSAVCLEWSATRALAAGATKDEVTEVLLAIVPVAGLGRVVSAAPELAAAIGYDVEAALEDPNGADVFLSRRAKTAL
jgi:alkylhydroperoxidase/carboxymuconolactone decarboxylase family protein YurZ